MSCKLFLVLSVVICVFVSLEAASIHGILDRNGGIVQKLDYEGVVANVRSARQTYPDDDSGEDSDEDDEEDDAELQHQAVIRRQQAYEQSVDNSQEGSDEDNENNFEEDDDDYLGRRLKRDVSPSDSNNEIDENSQSLTETVENEDKLSAEEISSTNSPASTATNSSNTSVLILIRDVIKKVTELPNTQQVATSAQQYFQMFEHFLQQTIEQVIGDDDEEDEVEFTTFAAEKEKDTITEVSDQNKKQPAIDETSDKEILAEPELPLLEKKPQDTTELKA